jgi:hypothetical protein
MKTNAKTNNFDLTSIIGNISGSGTTSTTTTSPVKLSLDATLKGMENFASLLPEGGLQDFFKDPIGSIKGWITGRVYQTGQYRLGERFIRHILGQSIGGYREVPDDIVPVSQQFFTMALGVDVNNDEDLMALDSGVDAYFARPDKQNVPVAAVQRAVAIKKYWPMVKDGQWFVPWPIDIIYQIKSDPVTMGYHSNLINKDLPAIMKNEETGESNVDTPGVLGGGKMWLWIILAVVLIAGIIYFVKYRKK